MVILTRGGHPWLGDCLGAGSGHARAPRGAPPEHTDAPAQAFGTAGRCTHLIRGRLILEHARFGHLFLALPPRIHIYGRQPTPDLSQFAVRTMVREFEHPAAGGQCVMDRLAHLILVEAVRACLIEPPTRSDRWLRALIDAEIGPALAQIHARPEVRWTVASLAATVSMSRSSFAAKFAAILNEPPLQYLTHYRMRVASELLRSGGAGIKEVASAVSYDSEASFSHAFKRQHGVAPGAYRQSGQLDPPTVHQPSQATGVARGTRTVRRARAPAIENRAEDSTGE